jgi:single-strand DNA-binding protein
MAASFNKVIHVGNLVRDPEIRYVGTGAAVTKFTLAVNRRTKQQEETDYIDCVAWDKLAETCNTYLKKGMATLVEGRLSIRSYETKEGEKRKATEIVLNTMQMLDRAGAGGGGRSNGDYNGEGGSSSRPPAGKASSFDEEALEDEIPF